LYFKTRNITKIRQGQPQPPTKVPTTIDESTSKREEVGPNEGKIEEVTSPKSKGKQPFPPIGRPTTRAVTSMRIKTHVSLSQEKTKEL